MKNTEKYIILTAIVIGVALLLFWFFFNPSKDLTISVPGMDNRADSTSEIDENVIIGENFVQLSQFSSELTGKWTRFRGADFDNVVKSDVKLISKFGDEGAKILWTVDLGEGHAAPVIYNGKVYILDYDEKEKADVLRCFALESGTELWQRSYNVHIKRNHGMSRTVPAISDSFIVTLGPKGHVMCSDPNTGNFLWGIDLVKEYQTELPFWYTGQCPLLDNDTAVFAPAGTSLLIGVDCATGQVVWETPNPDKWKMSHSSIMPMEFKGKKMYVYAAVGGICGISAEGNDKGQILWKSSEYAPSVVAPSPVVFDDGKIFLTAGYGAGSVLYQLAKSGENYSITVLQMFKPKDGVASEQQTPVVYNGYMYCILPKDAGSLRNELVCCKPDDCTNFLWSSGKEARFGLGPYIVADDKFFILDDDGTLTIAKVSSSEFIFLDKTKVIEGQDAWGPFAIADGKLLMRDSKKMVCVDIEVK